MKQRLLTISLLTTISLFTLLAISRSRSLWQLVKSYGRSEMCTIGNRVNIKLHKFSPVNDDSVFTFRNVCIEGKSVLTRVTLKNEVEPTDYNETMKIVVYDREAFRARRGTTTVNVAGSSNSLYNHWTLDFVDGPIPLTHHMQSEINAAYFVVPTCPGNFHHFWADEFVQLWSVINRTGGLRLDPCRKRHNLIAYRLPFHDIKPSGLACYNVARYDAILKTLNIDERHEVFWKTKANTCFSNGVFGTAWRGQGSERDVISHVVKTLLVDVTSVHFITVMQRYQRRLLNAVAMLDAARTMVGEKRARVVQMEDLTIEQQLRVVAESCVLIGVQGAGLQWAMFMNAGGNSTLIEIAWPNKHWPFYYHRMSGYGLQYLQLNVKSDNVHVNWTSYEWRVRAGRTVHANERRQMISVGPRNVADNLWKWADVVVDLTQFTNVLSQSNCVRQMRPR